MHTNVYFGRDAEDILPVECGFEPVMPCVHHVLAVDHGHVDRSLSLGIPRFGNRLEPFVIHCLTGLEHLGHGVECLGLHSLVAVVACNTSRQVGVAFIRG